MTQQMCEHTRLCPSCHACPVCDPPCECRAALEPPVVPSESGLQYVLPGVGS